MGNLMVVGIADQKVAAVPDILITYALGSCVGICLYDPICKIAGLSHILLPETLLNVKNTPYKFADTAINELVKAMERVGCSRLRLTAKIAGGANMFPVSGKSIGDRNIEMVKLELNRLNIRLTAEDTGANYGRTVEFNPADGSMMVKTVGRGSKLF